MISQQIRKFLENHHVKYSVINHPTAYTASQIAQSAHIPGRQLAKIVVVKIDDKLAMVTLPAHVHLDLDAIKELSHGKKVKLAREYEFNTQFPGCEVGAMPPFGELYNMDVYLADSLTHQDWVAFNGGTHSDLLKINCKELLKLVHPKLLPNC